MADTPRRRGLPPELAVAALVAAAALPLTRLFRPGGTAGVVLLSLACAAAVSWGLRRLRAPALIAPVLSALALGWFVSVRFFPDSLWGPFPSARTLAAMGPAAQEGIRQMIEEVAPVAPTPPLLMFVAMGVWATAWLAGTAAISLRNPLLGIAGTIPLFAVPGTLVESDHHVLDVILYLGAVAWVLFADQGARARRAVQAARAGHSRTGSRPGWRFGTGARLALAGAAVVLWVAPLLPGYGAPPGLKATGFGDSVVFNPLVAIRPTLNRNDVRTLFIVHTEHPTYHRLTSLELFDGTEWTTRASSPDRSIARPIDSPVPAGRRLSVEQFFEIRSLGGPWVPASYYPVHVDGTDGVGIETDSGTLFRRDGLEYGLQYFVTSAVPTPRGAALDRPFSYDTETLGSYLALPRGLPGTVRDLARRVAGAEPTPLRKAIALQNHLRGFTYDEKVAAGHSYRTLDEFLIKSKRGYCEQFAGSMAVLARALGIPSRVAIGFGVGERVADDVYRVTTKHAHAWPELFFPGAGWLAFEPTPRARVAEVPAYTVLDRSPEAPGGPAPADSPPARPDAAESRRPQSREPDGANAGADGGQEAQGTPIWKLLVATLAAAALLVPGAASIASLRRALRHRRARTQREAAAARYADFLDWCAAAGLPRRPAETPREHATRLSALGGVDPEPFGRLADTVEDALWSPAPPADWLPIGEAAARARSALASILSMQARLRANLLSG